MNADLWPYFELSRNLVKKQRKGFGNMFRHQVETFAILIEFGYEDPVLLKASLIHDLFEEGPNIGFNHYEDIISVDHDGQEVYDLVQELSIRMENGMEESKADFLQRILKSGSSRARLLKLADRLSNVNSLIATSDGLFIKKYMDETREYILPCAETIDKRIADEMKCSLKKLETLT